ncbi:MAG: aspartate aminotransferase, partial [Clostridia bacterium]|nr:aspartate aminotransferase [Clostridia bacterium]
MRYDFRTMLDRTGMDALAIDGLGMQDGFSPSLPRPGFDPIPMWVADMNFPTAPVIPEAIAKRVAHPAYGYFPVRKEYYDAIRFWQETRNGVTGLTDDCIGYENGVLGGLVSAVNVLCSRGGNILIHSPTYIGFTSCLENNGYHLVHSE